MAAQRAALLGGNFATMAMPTPDSDLVTVQYAGPGAPTEVRGASGRFYGRRKSGDKFQVLRRDAIAEPGRFVYLGAQEDADFAAQVIAQKQAQLGKLGRDALSGLAPDADADAVAQAIDDADKDAEAQLLAEKKRDAAAGNVTGDDVTKITTGGPRAIDDADQHTPPLTAAQLAERQQEGVTEVDDKGNVKPVNTADADAESLQGRMQNVADGQAQNATAQATKTDAKTPDAAPKAQTAPKSKDSK